uniref:Leukocyte surface antigen CD47 n=1 Tax=Strigops habroptila TaxID=2489341 RepID=A0A672UJS6_STRHB
MWLLPAWVLLSAVGAGSAQLIFSGTDVVERTDCNKTVILPCYVTNLKDNNPNVTFVTWKKQRKIIFSFDGKNQEFFRDPEFQSADLVSRADLPKGIASLMLSGAEATVGNYSCEVTESNREGETRIELRNHSVVSCGEENTSTSKEICGSWFLLMERAIIIALLFLVITLCAAQSSVIVLKYETVPQKKTGIIVAVIIFVVAAVVGTVLFVQGKCIKIAFLVQGNKSTSESLPCSSMEVSTTSYLPSTNFKPKKKNQNQKFIEHNRTSIVVVRPSDNHRETQTPNIFLFSVVLLQVNIRG